MNSEEVRFHSLILGIFIAILAALSVAFIRQDKARKERLFHAMLGLLSVTTLILIFVGAMVASTRSGMAFMDWPTSNGLIWPSLDKWIHQKDMFWEHFHRLIAEGVGFLAICTLIWSFFVNDKKYIKSSLFLLVIIIAQGIFGGLTVKRLTSWWTSSLHGVVAQLVLAYMAVLFVATSQRCKNVTRQQVKDSWLTKLPAIVCVVVLIQLLLGASFRHKMKDANFASSLAELEIVAMKSKQSFISFRQAGKVSLKVKMAGTGQVNAQVISTGGKVIALAKSYEATDEFITVGSFEVAAEVKYYFQFDTDVSFVQLVTKERTDLHTSDSVKELPFSIVYREVLEGNRHLLWSHIGFAIIVTIVVLLLAMYLMKKDHGVATLKSLGKCMLISLIVQLLLGLVALLTVNERQRDVYDQLKTILTSAHLANGAILLVCCVLVTYVCRQNFIYSASEES
jgi:heme A synthase